MNTKTAKHLKALAEQEAKEKGYPIKWAYRQLKELWKQTPKQNKTMLFK